MNSLPLVCVNQHVAKDAQGQQIPKLVVALLAGRGCALAINVMYVQIFLGAAVLACVSVALQGNESVAAEFVLILSACAGLTCLVWVALAPIKIAGIHSFRPAVFASELWSGSILKILSAIGAVGHRPNRQRPGQQPPYPSRLFLRLVFVGDSTSGACFLASASRFVRSIADYADALAKTIFCFSMRSKRARFASLGGWRSAKHLDTATSAGNMTIRHLLIPNRSWRLRIVHCGEENV